MRTYALEIIVFCAGAIVMVLEIAGTRLLAPYFGTALPVWTALISTVLASLSFGYYIGGKMADAGASMKKLSSFLITAGGLIGLTMMMQAGFLMSISGLRLPVMLGATIAALVLLAPAAALLGAVSPYATRLRLEAMSNSGATIGRFSALSTIGSIVGTVLAGAVLLQYIGSVRLLAMLAISLGLLGLLAYATKKRLLLVVLLGALFLAADASPRLDLVADIDTAYNRAWIADRDGVRMLLMGGVGESARFLNGSDELVFPYTRFYRLAQHFAPHAQRAVMLGGAGYSSPRDFLKRFPSSTIDVVEIDPGMTRIAREYFDLVDDPRLAVIHEDGRVFINHATGTYDVFFGDAFGSNFSVPYQLTTIEAAQKIHALLSENGVAILNLIGSVEGETGKFIRAEYHTYRELFPQVYLLPVKSSDPLAIQNIMLIALKAESPASLASTDPELNGYLSTRWVAEIADDVPVLTDDFAPVDQYVAAMIRGRR